MDKINRYPIMDTFDRIDLSRYILIIVVLIGLSIGLFLYMGEDKKPQLEGDEEFQINYNTNSITVTQIEGDPLEENLEVQIEYYNGTKNTKIVTINELNKKDTILIDKEIYKIDGVDLIWNYKDENKLLLSKPLPDKYEAQDPELNTPDVDARVNQNITISAQDYITSQTKITDFTWSLTGKTSQDSETIGVSYSEPGTYAAELTITDELGQEVTDNFTIEIKDPKLITTFNLPNQITTEQALDLDGKDYTTDKVRSYKWNINGKIYNEQKISHEISKSGIMRVNLTVTDAYGYSKTVSEQILVQHNIGLTMNVDKQDNGQVVVRTQSNPKVNINLYEWQMGDGTTKTTQSSIQTHTYSENGLYDISVKAITSDDRSQSKTQTVNISTHNEQEEENNIEKTTISLRASPSGWRIEEIRGAQMEELIENNNFDSSNPTLRLKVGQKYEFTNIERNSFELRDLFGDPVLSQSTETELEDSRNIKWEDDGDSVSFIFTDELAELVSGYQSATNPNIFDGEIKAQS